MPWTIDGVTVTLKVALGTDATSSANTLGNAGISFDVVNASGKAREVGVRLLLDTSLGNDIDAPYFVLDESIRPTLTESAFNGENVPTQIRCVDSLSSPKRLAYLLMQEWNGGKTPSKVILGHWANLANTRYEYTPDEFCDFTNYSNKHKTPDSAAALYWEPGVIARWRLVRRGGAVRRRQLLAERRQYRLEHYLRTGAACRGRKKLCRRRPFHRVGGD